MQTLHVSVKDNIQEIERTLGKSLGDGYHRLSTQVSYAKFELPNCAITKTDVNVMILSRAVPILQIPMPQTIPLPIPPILRNTVTSPIPMTIFFIIFAYFLLL